MIKNITYRQLRNDDKLTNDNLFRIARLIYKTDKYIYPCLFNSIETAEIMIHDLILSQSDIMFSLDNLFVAETNEGTVIGIILWIQGSLNWNKEIFLQLSGKHRFQIPEFFDSVYNSYFSGYSDIPKDTISILNVCVDDSFRLEGVATEMLSAYLAQHPNACVQLHVLAENDAALHLYNKIGFTRTETINGFSSDQRDLPCYLMKIETDTSIPDDSRDTNCFTCKGPLCPNHCCKAYSGFEDQLQAVGNIRFSEIILLPRDVNNLRKAGLDNLIRPSEDGHFTIATAEDGTCSALRNGKCSIYPIRPAICRCYPLYLDLFVGICQLKECPGVEPSKSISYKHENIEELLSIYEYWIDFYRKNRGDLR